jgi:hypothetical protein
MSHVRDRRLRLRRLCLEDTISTFSVAKDFLSGDDRSGLHPCPEPLRHAVLVMQIFQVHSAPWVFRPTSGCPRR